MAEQERTDEAEELRAKFDALKRDFADVTKLAKARAVDSGKKWAREHPVAAVGIVAGVAAGIGFLLGLLVGRRRD